MKSFICLLRGVNVGGRTVKMELLRKAVSGLGLEDVRTYIQSGNIFFKSPSPRKVLEQQISECIQDNFGFQVPVLVMDRERLSEFLMGRPEHGEDAYWHLTFLGEEVKEWDSDKINAKKGEGEEWYIAGSVVYVYCPNGYGKTELHNMFWEKVLKRQATTRNWRTSRALWDLSE